MLENNKNRIVYLDLLRIFSIFSMMLLHVVASNWSSVPVTSFNWRIFNVYDSLVRFCVPVFVMISGVFFLDNDRIISTKRLFTKNIFRIITAFIFWSLFYVCLSVCSTLLKNEPIDFINLFKRFLFGHYHMWFLFTLVGLYLITPLLRKITEEKSKMEYFIILFFSFGLLFNFFQIIPAFSGVIATLKLQTNIYFVLGYSGYFVLGLYLYKYELSKTLSFVIYILGVLSVIFTILASHDMSLKTGAANQAFYGYLLPNTFFSATAVFVFFKSVVSRIHFSQKSESMIFFLSKLTFCMYLVHDFVNIVFAKIGFTTVLYPAIISVPINSILVFIISFIIACVINKIPVLNKYVM